MKNSNLISLKKAIQLVDKEKKNLFKISKIKISEALNKVVAEDIISPINLPSLDCAGLDGFVFNWSQKSKLPISKNIYEFVGPICESTDKFTTIKKFQKLKEKDLIVMCDVGAYGISLSSNYNVRPKPTEVLIKGSKINIIRKRQKLKNLI